MTIKSWNEEFYRISASEVMRLDSSDEIGEFVEQRWIGTRKNNLEKHGMTKDHEDIYLSDNNEDLSYLTFGGHDCAWCRINDKTKRIGCLDCPAVLAGSDPCYDEYKHWEKTGDPERMIQWIRKSRKKIREQGEQDGCKNNKTQR